MFKRAAWIFLIVLSLLFVVAACGDDDDDDASADDDTGDDDDDNDNDDDDDNNDDDDDDDDDDNDDDDNDDDDTTPLADDWVAPWPQAAVEPADYDETVAAGALRTKAEEYDQWHVDYHQPYYGGTIGVVFTDETRAEVAGYHDWGDSCEWTGLYLGSQAMRYHITGDPAVKATAVRIAEYLSGNLHVTETPGFIARYWAEQDPLIYPSDAWCDDPAQSRCHHHETGPNAGRWWWGETSRDMYNGWMFGMTAAYDLVDDEDMREMIRDDVTTLFDTLLEQNWWILDEEHAPTDSAPHVEGPMRVAWILMAYHITGEARYKAELQKWLRNDHHLTLHVLSITFMNRYAQYYGNCLSHELWYNLLRLGKVYFSAEDYAFFLNVFETQVHTFTRLSHNAFYNAVFMSQGDYTPEAKDDPYAEQLLQDITEFRDAPLARYYLPERDPGSYELDPLSVFLHDLMEEYPFLEELMGGVNYQAQEAFGVQQQCSTDFLYQRNPFRFTEWGQDRPDIVNPGVDYLISYWMSAYHKFIDKAL
ncbi:MAG: hypothetical protein P9L99_06625 [Candidatus Lernaella stagnicola]|nr:hypothetical protein [Candidatus Lernaella stagnicola]